MDQPLVNRVANSGLITLNLETYFPQSDLVPFDLKDYLFMEMILKEKDFRAALKEQDWSAYQDKVLLVHCSADAIIPTWAYMLVAAYAAPYAKDIFQGTREEYLKDYYREVVAQLPYADYENQRIVVKGCSDQPVPPAAYLEVVRRLRPLAKSIMFGEPCSTVPIFKQPRKA